MKRINAFKRSKYSRDGKPKRHPNHPYSWTIEQLSVIEHNRATMDKIFKQVLERAKSK